MLEYIFTHMDIIFHLFIYLFIHLFCLVVVVVVSDCVALYVVTLYTMVCDQSTEM